MTSPKPPAPLPRLPSEASWTDVEESVLPSGEVLVFEVDIDDEPVAGAPARPTPVARPTLPPPPARTIPGLPPRPASASDSVLPLTLESAVEIRRGEVPALPDEARVEVRAEDGSVGPGAPRSVRSGLPRAEDTTGSRYAVATPNASREVVSRPKVKIRRG